VDLRLLEHLFLCEFYLPESFYCFSLNQRAIGVGAVQVNMAVFGAEQIQESKVTSRYFDKYYIAVNIGAIIATVCIPLIQTDSENETYSNSYFYGYLIALFMLIGAAVLFIIGYRYYIHIPPYDTVIMKCIPVVINAFQTWCKYHNNTQIRERIRSDSYSGNSSSSRNTISQEETMIIDGETLSFLDYAKAANHGKYNDRIVNDVKSLRRAIIVFLLLIPYWIIYYQVGCIYLKTFF
jgi:dipeptide/tripeptide permease